MVVRGTEFEHVVYIGSGAAGRPADDTRGGRSTVAEARPDPVWIYIEGDGIPWIDEVIPAPDPTPRVPVALPAMLDGPGPAVFLGRPCYLGMAARPPCAPLWWTHGRFAPAVIDSMAQALRRVRSGQGWNDRRVNLVGFSGGGTLAVLMAPHVDKLCAVITMASPLDIDEWTRRRGYSPMEGSLNPASQPALPATIRQYHLQGGRDRIVEPETGNAFRVRNPDAVFRVVPSLTHSAGWSDAWTDIREQGHEALRGCQPRD